MGVSKGYEQGSALPYHSSIAIQVLRGIKFFVRSRRNLRNLACSQPALFPSHTCHWKPLKTHAMRFIASGNLFSTSFQSQRKVLKITVQ